jgi:hypothetical protein
MHIFLNNFVLFSSTVLTQHPFYNHATSTSFQKKYKQNLFLAKGILYLYLL